jgi:hypothetical protein
MSPRGLSAVFREKGRARAGPARQIIRPDQSALFLVELLARPDAAEPANPWQAFSSLISLAALWAAFSVVKVFKDQLGHLIGGLV